MLRLLMPFAALTSSFAIAERVAELPTQRAEARPGSTWITADPAHAVNGAAFALAEELTHLVMGCHGLDCVKIGLLPAERVDLDPLSADSGWFDSNRATHLLAELSIDAYAPSRRTVEYAERISALR